jgi:hypothetical protein
MTVLAQSVAREDITTVTLGPVPKRVGNLGGSPPRGHLTSESSPQRINTSIAQYEEEH